MKTVNPFNFKELISPILPDQFFSDYWEKKPLVLNRKSEGYQGLPTLKEIESLLFTTTDPSTYWVKFVNNGKEIPNHHYCSTEGHYFKKKAVIQGFKKGNTIILRDLGYRSDAIRKLSWNLEEELGHEVRVNMYLTPSNAKGFNAHYDTHDVFILQMEGEKVWKVYDAYVPLPMNDRETRYYGPINPTTDITLKAGDLLYIPRGYVHEAKTSDQYSLHYTVGIHVFTWSQLIQEIVIQEPAFRKALPIKSLLNHNKETLQTNPLNLLKTLCSDPLVLEKAHLKMKEKFSRLRNDSFDNYLSTFQNADDIDEETVFKKREHLLCSVESEGEKATLKFGDQFINFSISAEPILNHIAKTNEFSCATLPDYETHSHKLFLIKTLVKSGLLVPITLASPK